MKLFPPPSVRLSMRAPLASEILDTIPAVMQEIRREMRGEQHSTFSVAEFRILLFVAQHRGTDLSAIADYVGLSLPSASRVVETLIGNGLLVRAASSRDRRRLALTLSAPGRREMQRTRGAARRKLEDRVGHLDPAAQAELARALRQLRKIFTGGTPSTEKEPPLKPRRVTTPVSANLSSHPRS